MLYADLVSTKLRTTHFVFRIVTSKLSLDLLSALLWLIFKDISDDLAWYHDTRRAKNLTIISI